jgi:hypothetical protein
MRKSLLAGAAAVAGLAASAAPAYASVHHAAVSTTYTITFTDHGDGGSAGNMWAEDNGQVFLTVTRTGTDTYTGHLSGLEGSFVTRPGELAPNQSADPGLTVTGNQKPGAKATITGSADYSFTADQLPLGAQTIPVTGDQPRMGTWEELAFPAGTDFSGGITDYSLIYRQKCTTFSVTQTWTETSTPGNNDGNAPGDGNVSGC